MDHWLNKLIRDTNGRYFSADEGERIAAYAETLPDRLMAAKRVEDAQRWLTRLVTDATAPRAAEWGLPREPLAQDLVRAVTPVVTAMLLDDPDVLTDAVVRPFEGLAAALDVPPADLGDLFDASWQGLATRLDPVSSELLGPFFARVVAGLRTADARPLLTG